MKKLFLFILIIFLSIICVGQTFTWNPSMPIPDSGPQICNSQVVSGLVNNLDCNIPFGLQTVCIDITHTWDSDLDIFLIAPDGTIVELSTDNGGSGDNYTNSCFNMTALTNITTGTSPFSTGPYIPEGDLSIINNGQNGNGTWQLCITDDASGDVGTLNSWQLIFGNLPACPSSPTCFDGIQNQGETGVDCGGPCTPCGLNHNIGAGNWVTCFGNLFDSGGPSASYSNNENITETYCSSVGNCIQITFNSFDIESTYDQLIIYDGPNATFPIIGTYDGTTNPGTITSSNGCLTFNFTSDASVTKVGWNASISCIPCPIPTCFDGIKNQGETGIDCGGPCTPCQPIIIPTACTTTTYILTTLSSVTFYDDGGSGGDPCNDGALNNFCNCNCFTIVTICGAPSEFVIADFRKFSMFNTTSGFDWFVVYDNNTTSGIILFDNRASGSTNGNGLTGQDNPLGDCNFTYGMMNYCSTGNCLTFQFWATGVVNREGWDALISSVSASCTTLPIELEEFSGYNKGNINYIYWVTSSEVNNDYFIIERSRGGDYWEEIATIKGGGNLNTPSLYEFNDESYIDGVNYYRLSQTDFDGETKVFKTISINTKQKNKSKEYIIVNLIGQRVSENYTGFRILIFEDGRKLIVPSGFKNPVVN